MENGKNLLQLNEAHLGPDVIQTLRLCGHLPPNTLNDLYSMIEKIKNTEQADTKNGFRLNLNEKSRSQDSVEIHIANESLIKHEDQFSHLSKDSKEQAYHRYTQSDAI